ncbi:hypothetical protein TSACC_21237 [Terrimicrobium sacchariphilum]|jgi:hypothetical protein|uniref:Uncharacterized protein n=2 Tax=Terrimicrobium sacchariphilum TaxID=690879 RepID=A0A146G4Y7_TERSA|nr:hypothetical protein TSACC_21237 [Terrimicrobium sacchariphilum]
MEEASFEDTMKGLAIIVILTGLFAMTSPDITAYLMGAPRPAHSQAAVTTVASVLSVAGFGLVMIGGILFAVAGVAAEERRKHAS